MIADVAQRVLTDPLWPELAAAVLATLGVALTVVSYTAWSTRHD